MRENRDNNHPMPEAAVRGAGRVNGRYALAQGDDGGATGRKREEQGERHTGDNALTEDLKSFGIGVQDWNRS